MYQKPKMMVLKYIANILEISSCQRDERYFLDSGTYSFAVFDILKRRHTLYCGFPGIANTTSWPNYKHISACSINPYVIELT